MNVKAALVRNTVWHGLVTVVGLGSGLLMSVVLARGLGPARMGDYAYVTWAWAALEAVATLGFALATARYTAEMVSRGERAAAWRFAHRLRRRQLAATALVVAAAVPLVLGLAPDHLRWPLLVVTVALFPVTIESIYTHALQGAQRYDLTARLSTVKMSLQITVTLAVLGLGGGVDAVFTGLGLTLLVSCWLARRRAMRVYATDSAAAADGPAPAPPDLRPYLVALSVVAVLDAIVWDRSEVFFLGLWGSAQDIAFYSLAFGLAARAMIIPEIAVGALLPAFAALHGAGHRQDFQAVYRAALRYVALAGALIAALLAALAPAVVVTLYGPAYRPAADLLSALAGIALLSALRQVAWMALPALGDRRSALAGTLVAAAVNLGLAALLIRSHGTAGAVVANGAGQAIAALWVFLAMARRHGHRFPVSDLARILAAGGLAFLVTRLVAGGGPEPADLLRAILAAGAGSLAFAAACLVLRVVRLRDWSTLVTWTRGLAATPPAP